jgi:hypothetical protein
VTDTRSIICYCYHSQTLSSLCLSADSNVTELRVCCELSCAFAVLASSGRSRLPPSTLFEVAHIVAMAINPPLMPDKVPMGIVGEFFALRRTGMQLKVDLHDGRGSFKATSGQLFVTTVRMCFVADRPAEHGIVAFDIPMQGISREEFKVRNFYRRLRLPVGRRRAR